MGHLFTGNSSTICRDDEQFLFLSFQNYSSKRHFSCTESHNRDGIRECVFVCFPIRLLIMIVIDNSLAKQRIACPTAASTEEERKEMGQMLLVRWTVIERPYKYSFNTHSLLSHPCMIEESQATWSRNKTKAQSKQYPTERYQTCSTVSPFGVMSRNGSCKYHTRGDAGCGCHKCHH